MSNSSEKGPSFSAKFGRLHGTNAWCPDPNEMSADGPYLQINLGQIYDICGVEAQGLSGTSVTTSFTLSYSVDGTFNDFNSNQVTRYCRICQCVPMSVTALICPSQPPRGNFHIKRTGVIFGPFRD